MAKMATGTSFADLLKERRIAAGLTQEALAERAQLSVRAISDLERGVKQRPYPHTVRRLSEALELDEEEASRLANAARGRGEPAPLDRLPLPLQPTPFIGRRHEVEEVEALLGREGVRLLTLTGPGGVGKTRLAFRVAEEVADRFIDGIAVVSLASLADPTLVAATVAAAVGLKEKPGDQSLEALKYFLAQRRLLLLLDNYEHLLPAASLVSELLASCPQLSVLVTSRAVLHLAAEHDYAVPPLAVPDDGQIRTAQSLAEYDAIALFVERAQAARAGFSLTDGNAPAVAELCRRLDGLPLAIELAAAHSRLFPPQALLQRLERRLQLLTGGARDVPARQQTMRNTIDWSHSLLSVEEQAVFRRLAVFVGGCSLETAEAVCGDGDDGQGEVLAGLESLVDKNLLVVDDLDGEPRFRMLETVREYGLERLAASGEMEPFRQRHAEAFLRLAEDNGQDASEAQQRIWLARLKRDHNNLRAALTCSLEKEPTGEMALRLSAALVGFWRQQRDQSEGRRWLEQSLALATASAATERFPRAWGKVVTGIGIIAGNYSDFGAAETFLEQGAAIWRMLNDQHWLGQALHPLAWVAVRHGHHDRARALLMELVEIHYGGGAVVQMGWTLQSLAIVEMHRGNLTAARSRLEEALGLGRTTGDARLAAYVLGSLAEVAWCQGDAVARQAYWDEALSGVQSLIELEDAFASLGRLGGLACRVGDFDQAERLLQERLELTRDQAGADESSWFVAWSLNHLGDVARCRGDMERAATLYGESLAVFRQHGDRQGIAALLHNLAHVELAQGNTGRAKTLFLESLTLFRELNFDWSMADCLVGLAGVASQEGRPERAATLFGAAQAVQEVIDRSGILTEPANEQARNRDIAMARGRIDEQAWEKAWSAGRAMGLDEAVAYARHEGVSALTVERPG